MTHECSALACVTHALSLKKPLVPSPLSPYHFELLGYRLVLLDVTMPEGHGLDSSSSRYSSDSVQQH